MEFDFQEIQFDYYFLDTTNMNVSVAELRMRDDIDTFFLGLLHIGDEENMEILESLCGSSWYTDEAAETSSLILSVVVTQAETSLV